MNTGVQTRSLSHILHQGKRIVMDNFLEAGPSRVKILWHVWWFFSCITYIPESQTLIWHTNSALDYRLNQNLVSLSVSLSLSLSLPLSLPPNLSPLFLPSLSNASFCPKFICCYPGCNITTKISVQGIIQYFPSALWVPIQYIWRSGKNFSRYVKTFHFVHPTTNLLLLLLSRPAQWPTDYLIGTAVYMVQYLLRNENPFNHIHMRALARSTFPAANHIWITSCWGYAGEVHLWTQVCGI